MRLGKFHSRFALAPALAACVALGCSAPHDSGAPSSARASEGELTARTENGTLDVERYDLRGRYDWARNTLVASVTVTLSPRALPPARVVLDSRVVAVKAVHLVSGEALPFSADTAARTLAIELGAHATKGAQFVIDYEASTAHGSIGFAGQEPIGTFGPREGDPVTSRVVYTFSEPEGTRAWMPSHDTPNDRAYFSVDLRVDDGEKLIANGDLVSEDRDGRTKYETSYTVPTYLMAFALGEFDVQRARGPHGLPLSIWYRRGLRNDYRGNLALLDRMIRRFEELTDVRYPFEKYALVLVPDFIGGEENIGITFQDEANSGRPELTNDNTLTVHELAHQWFGDLVTNATWDDLWFKEGMATLLQWEGTRGTLDRDDAELLDGNTRAVFSGQAVRDTSLPPNEKYTTGPYDRSAWLFSQIRSLIGEKAFWGTLKTVLTRYRFGAVSSEQVLEAFHPALGDEGLARVRRALDAQGLPQLSIEPIERGGRVTLRDPDGALVAPMRVVWHRADGTLETVELAVGQPATLARRAPGDFLVLDPRDVHPVWARFMDAANQRAFSEAIAPLERPLTDAAQDAFLEIGGAHQLAALLDGPLPPMDADDFSSFLRELDSDSARATAVARACEVASAPGGEAWSPFVKRVLRRQPFYAGLADAPLFYSACSRVAPPSELFPREWAALRQGLPTPAVSETEIEYLRKLSVAPREMLDVWSAVVEKGYSQRVRILAAVELRSVAREDGAVSAADRPAWFARIAQLMMASAVRDVQFLLITTLQRVAGPTASDNAAGLTALTKVLRTPIIGATHPFGACTAYGLTAGDGTAWSAFVASLEGAALNDEVRAILQDPAGACGGGNLRSLDANASSFSLPDAMLGTRPWKM